MPFVLNAQNRAATRPRRAPPQHVNQVQRAHTPSLLALPRYSIQQQIHSSSLMERDDVILYFTALLGIVLPAVVFFVYSRFFTWFYSRPSKDTASVQTDHKQKRTQGSGKLQDKTSDTEQSDLEDESERDNRTSLKVIYATETGTAREFSKSLVTEWASRFNTSAVDLADLTIDDLVAIKGATLFLVSTFIEGQPPDSCSEMFANLQQMCETSDAGAKLIGMQFGMFGLGNSVYDTQHYNTAAKTLYEHLRALGAQPFMSLALADETKTESMEHQFNVWKKNVFAVLSDEDRLKRVVKCLARANAELHRTVS